MAKIIQGLIALWLLWLPIAGVLYLFCNDSTGEAKSVTLSQVIRRAETHFATSEEMSVAMRSSSSDAEYKEKLAEASDQRLQKMGFEIGESIYDVLEDRSDVSFLAVSKMNFLDALNEKKRRLGEDRGLPRLPNIFAMTDAKELDQVSISFVLDGIHFDLKFLMLDNSFMQPWSAEFLSFDRIELYRPGAELTVEMDANTAAKRRPKVVALGDRGAFPVLLNLVARTPKAMADILPSSVVRAIDEARTRADHK